MWAREEGRKAQAMISKGCEMYGAKPHRTDGFSRGQERKDRWEDLKELVR